MNGSVKSVIVLTVICLVVTALLAVTNNVTAPIIEDSRQEKIAASLKEVLPDSGEFTPIEFPEGAPAAVKAAYRGSDGSYAVVLAARSAYSSGDMGITLGILPDGTINGIKLTSYQESKDFGRDTYPQNYLGKSASDYSSVDSFAGVTYSSKALKGAVADAFEFIELFGGGAAE